MPKPHYVAPPVAERKMARILLFDIECTSLKADFGFILCIGYKWYGEKKVYCPTMFPFNHKNFRQQERKLVKLFQKIFESADVIVTYNGTRFDVPWVQAKLIEHRRAGEQYILPNTEHIDLYQHVRKKFPVISRKSLANVSYYFGLSNEKTPVEGRIWMAAQMGSKKALNYIVKHCIKDVLVLEDAYTVMRPLIRRHPRVKGYGPCAACGSTHIISKGTYVTKIGKLPRRRTLCMDCHHWEDRLEKDLLVTGNYTKR